ncbi:adenosylcobinamide-GDP ribazoletransferase [Rhizobium sp. KVB221]|uniref:Adenosylcobinamide-GDP ribazoletransferase n=1 Tax=Rhizobium setariae TaxID=2801340 RepID=A0A937CMY4_9HYPH|nr:adenosylcobinamide-GDP ribazoletransferase [Rhizobium setariae]MBL0374870.1 adenosylcobinamide-GDP ribazoletransferase [Rhizobium setariae]
MKFGDYIDDIARSTGFLSRLPVPDRFFSGYDGGMGRAVGAFPIAGLLITIPSAAIFVVLRMASTEPLLAAMIALAVQTLLTGALHEDGLSDTADGVGGGQTRERALEIMRDSRIGSYGASALVISYGIRAAALASIAALLNPIQAGLCLVAVAALSRTAMVWHWSALPPARRDGVAASAGLPEADAVKAASVFACVIAVVALWPAAGLVPMFAAFAASIAASWAMTTYIRSRLGGHTGDTIGATQQCAEMAALCSLALAL